MARVRRVGAAPAERPLRRGAVLQHQPCADELACHSGCPPLQSAPYQLCAGHLARKPVFRAGCKKRFSARRGAGGLRLALPSGGQAHRHEPRSGKPPAAACGRKERPRLRGKKQKIYLCSILDLYDKSIVAYTISFRNDNKLVFDTFEKAIALNPAAKPIFHSDRGFQFTSKTFKFKLDQQGMIQSMSRVGKCIDNGPMEAFWGTIKSEMYYLNKFYTTDNLINSIIEYIEFYNNKRFQAILKSLTPIEYRNQALLA